MALTRTAPLTVEQFDQELAQLSIEGYWNTIGISPPAPKPRAEAYLWQWKAIYEARDWRFLSCAAHLMNILGAPQTRPGKAPASLSGGLCRPMSARLGPGLSRPPSWHPKRFIRYEIRA